MKFRWLPAALGLLLLLFFGVAWADCPPNCVEIEMATGSSDDQPPLGQAMTTTDPAMYFQQSEGTGTVDIEPQEFYVDDLGGGAYENTVYFMFDGSEISGLDEGDEFWVEWEYKAYYKIWFPPTKTWAYAYDETVGSGSMAMAQIANEYGQCTFNQPIGCYPLGDPPYQTCGLASCRSSSVWCESLEVCLFSIGNCVDDEYPGACVCEYLNNIVCPDAYNYIHFHVPDCPQGEVCLVDIKPKWVIE